MVADGRAGLGAGAAVVVGAFWTLGVCCAMSDGAQRAIKKHEARKTIAILLRATGSVGMRVSR